MLFIAVDQNLNGGKLRVLARTLGCSENEARGILISLWIWGISNCKPDGYIMGATEKDVAKALEGGLSKELQPEHVVATLISLNWIDRREESLYIHDWADWNVIPTEYYAMIDREQTRRDENRDRVRRCRAKKAAADSSEPSAKEAGKRPGRQKTSAYSESFETFWASYPRKGDKGQAYRKYQERLRAGYTPDELQTAAENYAAECRRNRTEQKYTKLAKTFLGDATPFVEYLQKEQTSTTYNEDDPYAGLM